MGNLNVLILWDSSKQVTKAVGNKSVLMWNDNMPIYIVSVFKYPLICPLKTKTFSTHNQIILPFAAFRINLLHSKAASQSLGSRYLSISIVF
jgi:hypothetical protein